MKKEIKKIIMGTVLVCGLGLFVWGKVSRYMRTNPQVTQTIPSNSLVTREIKIPVNETPIEIEIPFGMHINFKLKTKDVAWWVQINNDKIHERPPINSPEFKDLDYGVKVNSIKVWVKPNYKAELGYYFTPA